MCPNGSGHVEVIVYNFYMKHEMFFRKHAAVKKILKNIYDTV